MNIDNKKKITKKDITYKNVNNEKTINYEKHQTMKKPNYGEKSKLLKNMSHKNHYIRKKRRLWGKTMKKKHVVRKHKL